jgi:predicted PurR-regulated permease PerM
MTRSPGGGHRRTPSSQPAPAAEAKRELTGRRATVELPPLDAEAAAAALATEEEARQRLERSAWRWLRAAAVAVTLFAGWQLLLVVQSWVAGLLSIVLFVVFGAVVAFAAAPVMRGLERWARFPHLLAVLCSLATVLAVVVGLGWMVAGPLAGEAASLAGQAPRLLSGAEAKLAEFQRVLAAHGLNTGGGSVGSLLNGGLASHLGSLVVTGVAGVVNVVVDTVIVLVTAFWLLDDGPRLRRGFVQMLPARARDHAEFALEATQVVIGGYVRAQLVMALLVGVMAWLGCTGLGVPYPIVVGVAAGVFELVPLLGPVLGGLVGVLLALSASPVLALWTALLFVGIHVIEGYILAPRIQARFIQLHPLVAFLALIAGIEVDGLLGALFAVPLASLAAVFLRATIGDWRANRPEVFQGAGSDASMARRRRVLLRDFRVMRRSPRQLLAQVLRRGA